MAGRSVSRQPGPFQWWPQNVDRTPFLPLLRQADEDPAHLESYWARGRLLVALDTDGDPAAAAIWDVTADGPELLNIAVASDLRGRGLGRQAVQLVGDDASRSGGTRLLVATTPAGLAFYLRLGFRPVAVRRDAFGPTAVMEAGVWVRDQIVLSAAVPLVAL